MNDVRSLDYLSISVEDYSQVEQLKALFGVETRPLGHGMNYWRHCEANPERTVRVFSDNMNPQAKDSFLVELTGEGVRAAELAPAFADWRETCREVLAIGGNIKRVDPMIDNKDGRVKIDTLRQALESQEVVRHGKVWSEWKKHTAKGFVAETVSINNRSADVYFRCYDKGLESGGSESWLRFEFELKRDRADLWVRALVDHGWDHAFASLRGLIDVRVNNGDTNRSRWPVAEWWADLVSKSRVCLQIGKAAETTIVKKYNHVKRQCCKSLALVTEAFGGEVQWIYDAMAEGLLKFKEGDRNLLAAYERQMAGGFA